MTHSKNVQTVLDILKNEADGDVASALSKMTSDYSMTWMYQGREELFPTSGKNIDVDTEEIYKIRNRRYDIRNIAESGDVVMVEMIESYPDPETGKMYKTPQIIVLEFKDGKISRGRHYCDPRVSHLDLSDAEIERGLKGTLSKLIIK